MTFHRTTRIVVVILFALSLASFVAFRSGAFDRQLQHWLTKTPHPDIRIDIDSPPGQNIRKDISPTQSDSLIAQLSRELASNGYKNDSLIQRLRLELMTQAVRNYIIYDSMILSYQGRPYTTDTTPLTLIPFPSSKSMYLISAEHISQFTEAEKQKLHLIRMEKKMWDERWKADSAAQAEKEAQSEKPQLLKPAMLPGSKSISPLIIIPDTASILRHLKFDTTPKKKIRPLRGTKSGAMFEADDLKKNEPHQSSQ
jgi:hypothetical protein